MDRPNLEGREYSRDFWGPWWTLVSRLVEYIRKLEGGDGLGLKPGPFLDAARGLAAEVEGMPPEKQAVEVKASGSGFREGAGSGSPHRALRAEIREAAAKIISIESLDADPEESWKNWCAEDQGYFLAIADKILSLLDAKRPGEARSAEPEGSLPPKEYLLSAISCIHAGRGVKAIWLINKAINSMNRQAPPESPSSIQVQGATGSPASARHPQSPNQESK